MAKGKASKSIDELQEQLRKLKEEYESVSFKSSPLFKDDIQDAKKLEDSIAQMQVLIKHMKPDLQGINDIFKNSVNELSKGNKELTRQRQALNKSSSLANQLLQIKKGETSSTIQSIGKIIEKVKLEKEELIYLARQRKIRGEDRKDLESQIQLMNGIIKSAENSIDVHEKVNKELGFGPQLLAGMDKALQKLGVPPLGIDSALEETRKLAQEAEETGKAFNSSAVFAKQLGGNIKKAFSSANLLQVALMFIWDAMKGMDQSAGDLAKGMNLTYNQGVELNKELRDMAQSTGDIMVNQKGMQESLLYINKTMGTNVMLSKENLTTFTKLRESAGLTNEELMGSMKLTAANGKTLRSNVDTILKTTSSLNKQTGIYLNEKDILKDIDKISSATTLSLGQNPKLLAEAAATAKRLGLEMSQLESIADGMLNFEDSITKELEAELLLGKDITLEKARQAALNNDMATLAEEVARQAGSAAEFGKMNRIQQEALANAVGMNRDSLGETLFMQEQLKGLSKDEASRREELLQKRIGEVGLAQAMREVEEGGIEKLEQQASNAEKFAKTMEKLKETFVAMVDGPLGTILNMLASMLENTVIMKGVVGAIAGIFAGKMIGGIVATIGKIIAMTAANTANAAAATAGATAITLGGILPIILASVGAVVGLISSIGDDIVSKPGYGKRTLLGPEGAIQLNDKDTVIAGTKLFGDDVKSEPGKATKTAGKGEIQIKSKGGDMSAVISAINKLGGNLNAIASRPINVSIDGSKVITATTDQKPNETGDAVRKNDYKVQ